MLGKLCGVDQAVYHNDIEGSFHFPIEKLLQGVPESVTSCVVDIIVNWDLVKGMTSEYPLDGMIGRFYYRRRLPNRDAAAYSWGQNPSVVGDTQGVGFAQFRGWGSRSAASFPTSEPLELKIRIPRPVKEGRYRLAGCGHGVQQEVLFTGDTIVIGADKLVGPSPVQGGCMMFGFAQGYDNDGKVVVADLVLGVEVFGKNVMRLAGSVRLDDDKVCYDAEPSVSVAILNHGADNQLSTKLTDCFKMPADGKARLGFFTHKGRSVYAVIDGGKIEYVQ
jgi:hypothetical protein